MKIFTSLLVIIVLLLQYRVWIDNGGLPKQRRLQDRVSAQITENDVLRQRNKKIAAITMDLKDGLHTVEARARRELGMVKKGEVYYRTADY